jgi:hypothetical protein
MPSDDDAEAVGALFSPRGRQPVLNGNPFGYTIRVIPGDSAFLVCYTAVVTQ